MLSTLEQKHSIICHKGWLSRPLTRDINHNPMIGESRYEQWNVPTVNMKTAMASAIAATVEEL